MNKVSNKESQALLLGSLSAIVYGLSAYLIKYYQANNLYFQVVYLASVSLFPAILLLAYKKFICKQNAYCLPILGLTTKFVYFFVAFILTASFSVSFFAIFSKDIVYLLRELVHLDLYGYLSFFLSISILAAAFLGWTFFSKRAEKLKTNKLITLLVCFSPILLFDVMNNFDIEHYNAYLAPAVAVLNGKIPLIDVFCHYGLCYLIFTIFYVFLPTNYAIAAVIVSLLTTVCWIVFLLILRHLIRNPLYFCVLAVTSVFGANYLFGNTINMLPSALCMRYLPTILLSYFLLKRVRCASHETGRDTLFRSPLFNILLFLNVFWSFETLIALWIIYGAYLWISPCSFRIFFKNLGYLFLWIAGAYLAVTAVYWISFKQIPDYGIYLEYIYSYMNPYSKIGDRFLLPDISLFRDSIFWIFIAVLQLVCFFYFLLYRINKKQENIVIKELLFFNIVGIVFLAYFVLQPTFVTMMTSGYPSFILLFSVLVMEKENTACLFFKWCSSFLLFVVSFVFFVSIVKTLSIEYKDFYRNGDILYTVFHKRGFTLDRFLYNLTHFCSSKQISPGAGKVISVEENTCRRNAYHNELQGIIEKWYPGKKEILLFHRDLVETLMENNKVHKIFVSPMNDALLNGFRTKVLKSALYKIHEEEIVVVEKDLNIFPIEIKVLHKLNQIFNFILVEETPHFRVFKLKNREQGKSSDLVFPLHYKKIIASINYGSVFNGGEVKSGIRALFDRDKETVWFVSNDAFKNTDVFWIWVDLGDLFYVNDIKIWRRIDFRRPDYGGSENLRFLRNFNIEVSDDNTHWAMKASEKDFYIGDRYYFESKLQDTKMRYMRLNIFVDDLKGFSISEIEIFGKKVNAKNE